jgi:glycosyltransferase involved in cell wall biosynthesis
MTKGEQLGGGRLRVCLLHNYRESQQMSMKLYADRLGTALEAQDVAVERLRPREVLPARWRAFWLGDKVDSYAGRFLYYPRIAAAASSSPHVYHIVDHGQAFLIGSVDPRRTVVTCHDLMLLVQASGRLGSRARSGVALTVFRRVVQRLRLAAAVVAVSEQTRRDLTQFLDIDPCRIEVISSGLNQPFAPASGAREAGRRRWGLHQKKVVLQIGDAFYKNVETCLHIVARLRRRGLAVTFLRGGRLLSPRLLILAENLGIQDLILDLGRVPDSDLPLLYNAADVLLCPSLYEGFGWPPLEAMACGTPVVCSRGGSLAEIAGPAALTADPEDIDHLVDHVGTVLTDATVAARLRERGIHHAARFDWSITARKLVDLYQRVREAA